jgi:hypothetical protein
VIVGFLSLFTDDFVALLQMADDFYGQTTDDFYADDFYAHFADDR